MPWMDKAERFRIEKALLLVRGRLLDLGCGYNNLVRRYGSFGVGVDVFPWPGVDVLIGDSARLPFPDESFDSVAILAALNHIPNREQALREVNRVLCSQGRVIVSMINPFVGILAHIVFRQDEQRRSLKAGERKGMWDWEVRAVLNAAGFHIERVERFELGLNRIYLATKKPNTSVCIGVG